LQWALMYFRVCDPCVSVGLLFAYMWTVVGLLDIETASVCPV